MARKTKNLKYYEATGSRKQAIARVRLYLANKEKPVMISSFKNKQTNLKIRPGEIYVNKKPIEKLFSSSTEKAVYLLPLMLTDNIDRFAISILVRGGGKHSQLQAISHGLSRALCEIDKETYRQILKKNGLLTRDPRGRERRKVGMGGKARRAKQSPKR